MGYRFYLYTIDKAEIEKVKDKDYKELAQEFGDVDKYNNEEHYYFSPCDLKSVQEFHELGKYLDEKLYDGLTNNSLGTMFTNEEVVERITEEHDLGFLDAEGFKKFLESLKDKVLECLEDDLKDTKEDDIHDEKSSIEKMQENYKEKIRSIKIGFCYNLDLNKQTIQNSYLYEYVIFDLIHFYKIINWDKQYVMFYAY